MAKDNTVEIKVDVDNKDVKPKLTQTQRMLGGLKDAIAALGIAAFASQLWEAGKAMFQLAMETDAARTRLGLLVGGTQAANAYIRAIRESTNGAVDSLTAMRIATDAANYGFAKSPEQVAELSRNIMILSGGNVELAQSFLYMASNGVGSIERLNEFGLSAAKVRQRMRELQAANKALTTDEAFAQAVMAEMSAKAEQLGGTLDTSAAAAQRLSARWQEMKVDAAEATAVGVTPFLDALDALNEKLTLVSANGTQLENFFTATEAMAAAEGAFLETIAKGGTIQEALIRHQQVYQETALQLGAISTEESRAADEAAALAAAEAQAADSAQAMGQATAETAKKLRDMRAAAQDAKKEAESGFMAFEDLYGDEGSLNAAVDESAQQLQGLASVPGGGAKDQDTPEEIIKEAIYRRLTQIMDDPIALFQAKVGLGLASEGDLQKMQELERLAQLYATGQISADQLNAGAEAVAAGNLAASQAIKGTGPTGTNISSQMGSKGGKSGGRGGKHDKGMSRGTSYDPTGAMMGGTSGGNGTVRVEVTGGDMTINEMVEQGIVKALKQTGVNATSGSVPKPKRMGAA